MPENIFEHTTSITGITCKPLSILSETISPQEMSMARGGNGTGSGGPGSMSSGQPPTNQEGKSWQEAAQKALEEQKPPLPGLHEGGYIPDPSSYNIDGPGGPGGEGINPIGDAFEWCVNLEDAWEDLEDAWDWLTGEEEDDEGEEDGMEDGEDDDETYNNEELNVPLFE